MRHLVSAFVLLGALSMGAHGAQTPPAAATLAQQVQARYAGVHDFTADFTQTYSGGLLPQTSVERGQMKIKKPGRMRFSYESPARNEFVSDGRLIQFYDSSNRHVRRWPMPEGQDVPTSLLFLTGRGNLATDFVPSLEGTDATEWRLKLVPRTSTDEFASLVLLLDPSTLQIRGLVSFDAQGGQSVFRFTRIRENVKLDDRDFQFTPPRGTVIDDGQ